DPFAVQNDEQIPQHQANGGEQSGVEHPQQADARLPPGAGGGFPAGFPPLRGFAHDGSPPSNPPACLRNTGTRPGFPRGSLSLGFPANKVFHKEEQPFAGCSGSFIHSVRRKWGTKGFEPRAGQASVPESCGCTRETLRWGVKVLMACLYIICWRPSLSMTMVKLSNARTTPRIWNPFVKYTVTGMLSLRSWLRNVSWMLMDLFMGRIPPSPKN